MSVFFTADLHLGHGNIIKYCNRPFLKKEDKDALEENGGTWKDSRWRISRDAVDMMNDAITDNINAVVGPTDTLWILGDFMFAQKDNTLHKAEFYRGRIKCKNVNLIWGNHDDYKIRPFFQNTYDLYTASVNGRACVLCHYALAVWNKSHHGAYNLYGHSHNTAEPWLNRVMKGRRSMDVGIDNAVKILGEYRPFSFEEIDGILSKREGVVIDHHGE